MAVWRTKAYELFDLKHGAFSFGHGKIELFADLVERARQALRDNDDVSLKRVVEYVTWAAAQKSDHLASGVELAFFLPVFRDPPLYAQLKKHFSAQLLEQKWQLLMVEPSSIDE
jgi:hypothetical protein